MSPSPLAFHTAPPQQAYSYHSPWFWAVPAVCVTSFLIIWLTGSNQGLFLWINHWGFNHGGRSEAADVFWANATLLGDTLAAFSLLGLFARQRFDIVWALLLAALFSTLWVHGLKNLLDTLRPLAVLGPDQVHVIGIALHKSSFPSGHTATAFTLAGIICLQRVPPALAWTVLSLATLAGLSRAAVGAHWPLDILAGAFGGWLCAAIGVALARRWPTPTKPAIRTGITLVLLLCALALLVTHESGYPGANPLQRLLGGLSVIVLLRTLWTLRPSPSRR